MKVVAIITGCLFLSIALHAQTIPLDAHRLQASSVYMSFQTLMGKRAVRLVKDSTLDGSDQPTFARVKGVDFKNGTIEVKVLSRLVKNAPAFARGFIGIAFRINDSNTKFEGIYVRPVNARVNDQVRRNHTNQYFSYPDYDFDRLRKESPEKYESYTDMEMNKWITLRIEVKDSTAKLYINNNPQPSLVVNDLKLGAGASGAIGLWVETGTEGFFSDLKVKQD